jgi:hypothetical protein
MRAARLRKNAPSPRAHTAPDHARDGHVKWRLGCLQAPVERAAQVEAAVGLQHHAAR